MSKLTASARDEECLVRLAGVCNGNPETTILAHFRMSGTSGMGIKPEDWQGAFACSACHTAVDTYKDPSIQLDFAKGVLRTIARQIEKGLIRV